MRSTVSQAHYGVRGIETISFANASRHAKIYRAVNCNSHIFVGTGKYGPEPMLCRMLSYLLHAVKGNNSMRQINRFDMLLKGKRRLGSLPDSGLAHNGIIR
jgi:hypothetical protein